MSIPKELQEKKRWVCFGADKMPVCPATGGAASSTDPNTWDSYAAAAEAVTRLGCRGIGFVLGDGVCGIDIDHCIDTETGELDAKAAEIVEMMHSYTEYSPSGTGLHILWLGKKAGKACRKALGDGVGLEMYDGGRYFTVTGRAFARLPLAQGSEAAAVVYHKYLARPEPAQNADGIGASPQSRAAMAGESVQDTEEILERAKAAKGGDKLAALMAGGWQGWAASQSEADLALCNLLAFWLGCDKARMDAAFRKSGLYRKKWEERRGADTYGNITLQKAIDDCREVYESRPATPPLPPDTKAFLESMGAGAKAAVPAAPQQIQTALAPGPGKETVYSMDDTGNARRFRDDFVGRVHYNYTQKCWMLWDGKRWRRDETAGVKQLCDAMLDNMEKHVFGIHDADRATALRKFIGKSRGSHAKDNLLTEAQHLAGIPSTDSDYDCSRGYINLQNGILKLSNGKLKPHDKDKMMTRLAGATYDEAATAPTWARFLQDVTGGDAALQKYLQCMVGYMLTGSTREQCLFFLYGDGSNGKSTFLDVLADLLGNYAMNTQSDTITQRRQGDGPRTDIARLKGARLVTISECPADVWLDEAICKQLTGGDTVTARYLYGREFEFKPEFKLIMATNHKPRIRGTDAGIWRRIRLVPFTQCIPEEKQDLQLPDKLHDELPGILNWAIEGLREWLAQSNNARRRGLPKCDAVDNATSEYRGEQDRLRIFMEECTEGASAEYTVAAATLYKVYTLWCEENGERFPMTSTKFGREIGKSANKGHTRCGACYTNMKLGFEGTRLLMGHQKAEPGTPRLQMEPEQLKMVAQKKS